jgi:cell division protein FtsB
MEENIKNRVILILLILTVIFLLGTLHSCSTAKKLQITVMELDKEKSASWDSEQKMNDFKKNNTAIQKELETLKADNDTVKKSLLQEQLISQSLKDELQKVNKLKDTLEADLKDALVKEKTRSFK